jgi:hypothetical protein
MANFDPWEPISAALYEENNADLVQMVIDYTGVTIPWPRPAGRDPHVTRIRAYRLLIQAAYSELPEDEKGRFAQIVAKRVMASSTGNEIKRNLSEGLSDIGWALSEQGVLVTQDALVSEQFFPAGTEYDSYVAIRSILYEATTDLLIADPYMGSSLFATLLASPHAAQLSVQLLTSDKAKFDADFELEGKKFSAQYAGAKVDVRKTQAFHDRVIAIDGAKFYHIGASVKDAGKRAFLVSQLQDQPVIDSIKQYLAAAWNAGVPVP